jgi:hypothetical protein
MSLVLAKVESNAKKVRTLHLEHVNQLFPSFTKYSVEEDSFITNQVVQLFLKHHLKYKDSLNEWMIACYIFCCKLYEDTLCYYCKKSYFTHLFDADPKKLSVYEIEIIKYIFLLQ